MLASDDRRRPIAVIARAGPTGAFHVRVARLHILLGTGEDSMASRPKVTQQKRARERARQERQQEKVRRREEAKLRRANTPGHAGDEDPDIAGIIPGPQPSPWGDEEEENERT
jgi:hypothetical protein